MKKQKLSSAINMAQESGSSHAFEKRYDPLYNVMKMRAYHLVETITGHTHKTAADKGFRDLWDMVMSDSDHARQYFFLAHLPNFLSESQRQILLDGLALEYQGCKDWMTYVDRETS